MEPDGQDNDFNASAAARTGVSSVLGKCTEPVKVWLPLDIEVELKRIAASDGATASEFLRDMVLLKLRGKTWGELQAESRRAAILGTGPVTALTVRGEVKAS